MLFIKLNCIIKKDIKKCKLFNMHELPKDLIGLTFTILLFSIQGFPITMDFYYYQEIEHPTKDHDA